MLQLTQFTHTGLSDVYFTGHSTLIPQAQWWRCYRLLYQIASAVSAASLRLPGSGFSQQGNKYSLVVAGANRITYEWRGGVAADIDYV